MEIIEDLEIWRFGDLKILPIISFDLRNSMKEYEISGPENLQIIKFSNLQINWHIGILAHWHILLVFPVRHKQIRFPRSSIIAVAAE